jgi:hypothetical protein
MIRLGAIAKVVGEQQMRGSQPGERRRRKGTPNKTTTALKEALAAKGARLPDDARQDEHQRFRYLAWKGAPVASDRRGWRFDKSRGYHARGQTPQGCSGAVVGQRMTTRIERLTGPTSAEQGSSSRLESRSEPWRYSETSLALHCSRNSLRASPLRPCLSVSIEQ